MERHQSDSGDDAERHAEQRRAHRWRHEAGAERRHRHEVAAGRRLDGEERRDAERHRRRCDDVRDARRRDGHAQRDGGAPHATGGHRAERRREHEGGEDEAEVASSHAEDGRPEEDEDVEGALVEGLDDSEEEDARVGSDGAKTAVTRVPQRHLLDTRADTDCTPPLQASKLT